MSEAARQEHPFEPVFDGRSRILILGSFPSVRSREEGFYYAHPQNRFWRVLSRLLDLPEPKSIPEKKQMLLIGEGSRTSVARERIFSALFALFSLQGDSLAASKRTKITRKSSSLGCRAVFTELICDETRRSVQGILPYFQGLQRSIGANQPVKTGRCSTPFAYSPLGRGAQLRDKRLLG